MAVSGWILDKSAAARSSDLAIRAQLIAIVEPVCVCPMSQLEQLYSARSGRDYDRILQSLHHGFATVAAPMDILERALHLQRDLAHHHGLWHRIPIPDLVIAETALHHNLGVVHVDGDFARIAEVRPLVVRRVG